MIAHPFDAIVALAKHVARNDAHARDAALHAVEQVGRALRQTLLLGLLLGALAGLGIAPVVADLVEGRASSLAPEPPL